VNNITDVATLESAMVNHITQLVSRWKGKVYAWDVINEPFNDDETATLRKSAFYNVLGPDYIPIALKAARAADPTAKLYINEYSLSCFDLADPRC
jgi:endo-1,4-beta-xylanase